MKKLGLSILPALLLGAAPASALEIIPTYDTSITSAPNAADIESGIATAISAVDALYGNPITVNILFQSTPNLGAAGLSFFGLTQQSYSQYVALLDANAAAHSNNTVLATAVQHLNEGNGANPKDVLLTSANAQALGLNVPGHIDINGNYIAAGAKYDGVVTINSNYSFTNALPQAPAISIAEHEINEVLGGGGGGSMEGKFDNQYYGSLDPYRYVADIDSNGVNHPMGFFDPNPDDPAPDSPSPYFSVDGGYTYIIGFSHGEGLDPGDFSNFTCFIQSAFVCNTVETYATYSPEYTMMQAIGYDPFGTAVAANTPLPSTWTMLIAGFVGFGFFACRGTKNRTAATAAA